MTTITYDPNKKYHVTTSNIDFIKDQEESFVAKIYQPDGPGPFPVLLDVHGGAWQGGTAEDGQYFDQKLAESGILVAAIDFRVAPKYPYPAQVADVNYGARWWKSRAKSYNGDPSSFGVLGISSGGHTAMLAALCPTKSDYLKRPSDKNITANDASVDYYIGISAVLDSHARYLYAKEAGMENLIQGSLVYFGDEESMRIGSPQFILESGAFENLPPALLIHGTSDANVPNYIPDNFEAEYRSQGGDIELVRFDGMHHSFVREPLPESDKAIEVMKNFISKQVSSSR